MYQIAVGNLTYTFGISAPSVFFDENPDKFAVIVSNYYFLSNRDDVDKISKNVFKE